MTELKPCPFCGNRAYIFPVDEEGCCTHEEDADAWAVRCGTCSARMCEGIREAVIDEWNARIFREKKTEPKREEEGGCKPFIKGPMNVSTELKPCPFCGMVPQTMNEGFGGRTVFCHPKSLSCFMTGFFIEADNQSGIDKWNRRASQ